MSRSSISFYESLAHATREDNVGVLKRLAAVTYIVAVVIMIVALVV